MIIVLTVPEDAAADRVCATLTERGADVLRFDPADFPSSMSVTLESGPASATAGQITVRGRSVKLADISAVWIRRPGSPVAAHCVTDSSARAYVEAESSELTRSLWHTLHCRFLPAPPAAIRLADQKPVQLAIADELGFEIPPTIVTNDPKSFLGFFRAHAGRIITKPLGNSDLSVDKDTVSRYADPVSHRDVGFYRAIALCPVIVQAYVPKQIEVRVTVVGETVFAAEIHSQSSHHTRHDWRKYDHGRTRHAIHRLPEDIASRCITLTRRFGLRYSAIDLILTPDDRYVFLEINPNGEYIWIEDATGQPISNAIADDLIDAVFPFVPSFQQGVVR